MSQIIIDALVNRIKAVPPQMTIDQVPLPLREQVQAILDGDSNG